MQVPGLTSSKEGDGRVYADFAQGLRADDPDSARRCCVQRTERNTGRLRQQAMGRMTNADARKLSRGSTSPLRGFLRLDDHQRRRRPHPVLPGPELRDGDVRGGRCGRDRATGPCLEPAKAYGYTAAVCHGQSHARWRARARCCHPRWPCLGTWHMQPVAPTAHRYDATSTFLHWATAVLVVTQWLGAQATEWFPCALLPVDARLFPITTGVLLATLLLGRVAWRITGARCLPLADKGYGQHHPQGRPLGAVSPPGSDGAGRHVPDLDAGKQPVQHVSLPVRRSGVGLTLLLVQWRARSHAAARAKTPVRRAWLCCQGDGDPRYLAMNTLPDHRLRAQSGFAKQMGSAEQQGWELEGDDV